VSALEPGLYRANVRGIPGESIVIVGKDGDAYCLAPDGETRECYVFLAARPLIVLDLENPAAVVRSLREATQNGADLPYLDQVAASIEAQTRVRPAEPSDPAVRVKVGSNEWAKIGPWWVCADIGEVPRQWDYLVDRGVNQ